MAIDYIPNENIDFKKWDKCIRKAFNGTIYAYSWYLNIVSDNWCALVENDYERVMPLPFKHFAGTDIIKQPDFAGQLGVFSTSTLDESKISSFIQKIPQEYKYVNLKMNKHNMLPHLLRNSERKVSFDLDLIKPYDKLRDKYPDFLKHLLEKAANHKFHISAKVPIESIIKMKQSSSLTSYFKPVDIITMQLLVTAAVNNKMGQMCGVYGENEELYAVAFFVWSHQKASLVFHILNHKKFELPAFFFLIDDFIRNNSEKNLILHFELHKHSKLVSLLEKIGAKKSESFYYYRNHLPWYLKPFVA